MIELYAYPIKVFAFSLAGFLIGVYLREEFEIDYYSVFSILTVFLGSLAFLFQIVLNQYFGAQISLFDSFPDFLVNQFGNFVLTLICWEIYKKNFA